ncbi:MAG: DUF86 domain-containing protein [Thermoguttaceae bacterium]|jgi:uncharacterized protein with HEPN domain
MKHDETLYLRHIVDAIDLVHTYLQGIDETIFLKTSLIQDGVIRQIEIIGEAARHLSKEFRRQFEHIPWTDIAGMRDKLIHDYFGVDVEKVWLTAIKDLPDLKIEVQKILDSLSEK